MLVTLVTPRLVSFARHNFHPRYMEILGTANENTRVTMAEPAAKVTQIQKPGGLDKNAWSAPLAKRACLTTFPFSSFCTRFHGSIAPQKHP